METLNDYWTRATRWVESIGLNPDRIIREPIEIFPNTAGKWWYDYTELMLDSNWQTQKDHNGNPNCRARDMELTDEQVDYAIKLRLVPFDPRPTVCEHCQTPK